MSSVKKSFVKSIIEEAEKLQKEQKLIENNILLLIEQSEDIENVEQLNEAVTTWLAKVRNAVATNKLKPELKRSVAEILGALEAISNEDFAEALDEKGDLGVILYNVSGKDPDLSNAALKRLREIGRNPSLKQFVANALAILDDPTKIDSYTKKIQAKIEPVMNKKLNRERKQEVMQK